MEGGSAMLIVKVMRVELDQPQPKTVVATADQRVVRQVLRLIREAIRREEGDDGSVTGHERRQLDD